VPVAYASIKKRLPSNKHKSNTCEWAVRLAVKEILNCHVTTFERICNLVFSANHMNHMNEKSYEWNHNHMNEKSTRHKTVSSTVALRDSSSWRCSKSMRVWTLCRYGRCPVTGVRFDDCTLTHDEFCALKQNVISVLLRQVLSTVDVDVLSLVEVKTFFSLLQTCVECIPLPPIGCTQSIASEWSVAC